VAVLAVTSVAAKMSRIVAGVVAFGDRLMAICCRWARTTAFLLVLVAAALTPGPVRARGKGSRNRTPSVSARSQSRLTFALAR
jgi:hypothetical protein